MNRNEILRTRLKRAVDNGFVLQPHTHFMTRDKETGEMYGFESIIFDPEFAKALWGEKEHNAIEDEDSNHYDCSKCGGADLPNDYLIEYCFQWHLLQMAVAPDRLEYLEVHS